MIYIIFIATIHFFLTNEQDKKTDIHSVLNLITIPSHHFVESFYKQSNILWPEIPTTAGLRHQKLRDVVHTFSSPVPLHNKTFIAMCRCNTRSGTCFTYPHASYQHNNWLIIQKVCSHKLLHMLTPPWSWKGSFASQLGLWPFIRWLINHCQNHVKLLYISQYLTPSKSNVYQQQSCHPPFRLGKQAINLVSLITA